MPFTSDTSKWPIAVARIEGKLVGAEIEEWVAVTTGYALRHEPYVVIIDLLEAATPSAEFVRKQAEGQKNAAANIAAHCKGIAFVISSPMIRGALRAILHLQALPAPYKILATMDESFAWASEQLA